MRFFPVSPLAAALRLTLLGCGFTSAIAAAQPVAEAASSDDATTLDRITVRGHHTPLDNNASGGTRLALSLRDTPASVFIVDDATLAARGVRTTQEALFALPGLVVASPPGHGNTVTWRGFSGAQITQLFNGIDVKYASIAARPVDAWLLDRVEAIGGPSSFLHGAGAVGGSIDYVTKLANFDADTRGGLARFGSFGTGVLAAGINHRFGGDDATQALRLDAGHSRRDGWTDGEERDAFVGAFSLASRFGDNIEHTLALEFQDEDNDRVYWAHPPRSRHRAGSRSCRARRHATTTSATATTANRCCGRVRSRRRISAPRACATRSTTTTPCAITATWRATATPPHTTA